MKKQSLAYTLGLYLGEFVINEYLPTLSIDDIQSNTVIKVNLYDKTKELRLKNNWFATTKHRTKDYNKETEANAWSIYITYVVELRKKYLPKELKLMLPDFQLSQYSEKDQKQIIKGFIHSLWDCDCCTYSLKNEDLIFITHDGEYENYTELTMNLDTYVESLLP